MERKQDILKDIIERERALDCSRSIHCESPAGAGKTTLLTQRFLKLLSRVNHPHELLALTFTNKAAGEMRERIWEGLRMAREGRSGQAGTDKWSREALIRHKERIPLLFSPDGLRIMTFHSLCHSIVKFSPLEAELPPSFSVVEGEEYEDLLAKVTERTLEGIALLKNTDVRRSALERWLLRANNNWQGLRNDCIGLIKRRDYLRDLITFMGRHKEISTLKSSIDNALGDLINRFLEKTRSILIDTDLGRCWREFSVCLGEVRDLPPDADWSKLPQWQRIAAYFTTTAGAPRKRFKRDHVIHGCNDPEFIRSLIRSLPEDVCLMLQDLKALPVEGYDVEQIECINDLILILGDVIKNWQEMCIQRAVMDFVGLELACLKVLRQMPFSDIQLVMDSRIRHILVDEFQDTSRNQWELLQLLCSGWTAGDGRTLFLVGDPKQSIYAFRKAEVSLFLEAKDGLLIPGQGRLPIESAVLKNNFRSRPGLVEWTNSIFGDSIMANPRTDMDEVPFSPAIASTEADHELSLAIFTEGEDRADPKLAEAKWIARAVKELDGRTGGEESIGILLFTRRRITYYLRAFNDLGIPVRVKEGIKLIDSFEVVSLHQMVRALVHPHDDIAWVSLLRSPWFCSDPELLRRIWEHEGIAWAEKISGYIRSSEGSESLKGWWEIIKRARMRFAHEPLSKTVKDAWIEMEGPAKLASRLGSEAVENCIRYLEILEGSEQFVPEVTLKKAEQALNTAYMPSPPEAQRSKIEIMTVHGAKGLEFDYVFCPFLDWNPIRERQKERDPYILEGTGEGSAVLALRKDQRIEDSDPIYMFLDKRRAGKRLGEVKRLFYVAVTRARKGLYLSGVANLKDEKIQARHKHSPLYYVLQYEGIDKCILEKNGAGDFAARGTQGIKILLNPVVVYETVSDTHPSGSPPIKELPEPFALSPEMPPFTVLSPSEMGDEEEAGTGAVHDELFLRFQKGEGGGDSRAAGIYYFKERARGIVIHQIFSSISRGYPLPSDRGIAASLYREGVSRKEAMEMAPGIYEEIKLCMEEPFCAWINSRDHSEAYTEFSLEDILNGKRIRSGIIDRLIYSQDAWWIIDYKTIDRGIEYREYKGDTDTEAFFARQASLYKKQIESYRAMFSNLRGAPQGLIHTVLYFTAFRKPYFL